MRVKGRVLDYRTNTHQENGRDKGHEDKARKLATSPGVSTAMVSRPPATADVLARCKQRDRFDVVMEEQYEQRRYSRVSNAFHNQGQVAVIQDEQEKEQEQDQGQVGDLVFEARAAREKDRRRAKAGKNMSPTALTARSSTAVIKVPLRQMVKALLPSRMYSSMRSSR